MAQVAFSRAGHPRSWCRHPARRLATGQTGLEVARGSGYPLAAFHSVHVTDTSKTNQKVLTGCRRWLVALVGAGLLLPFGAARYVLKPDVRGYGTHQQVGLPPCTFRAISGLPCPSCGATTAWTHLVRGEVISALQVNAGGTVLAWLVLLAVPWLWLSALRGRWVGFAPQSPIVARALIGVVLTALVHWIFRLLAG